MPTLTLTNGPDAHYVTAAPTAWVIDGLAGDDLIEGANLADTLRGGADNDILDGYTGNDALYGEAGDDGLWGSVGADTLYGGDGADVLNGEAGNDILYDGAGDDQISGGDGNDILYSGVHGMAEGGAGHDTIYGDNSLCFGGDGNDVIYSTWGEGGLGNDRLYADATRGSQFWGQDGADTFYADGLAGPSMFDGGAGNDIYYLVGGDAQTVEAVNQGYDIVRTDRNHTLEANIEGGQQQGATNVSLNGNGLANNLAGNTGNNTLRGLAGVDTIDGSSGDDVIEGGVGNDILRGGADADQFVFRQESLALAVIETDQVFDYAAADGDWLDFSDIDANAAAGGDQAFTVVSAFSKVAGQMSVTLSGANTLIRLDVNGDGRADYQLKVNGDVTGETGNWML